MSKSTALCPKCAVSTTQQNVSTPSDEGQPNRLALIQRSSQDGRGCDICQEMIQNELGQYCRKCDFNVCQRCAFVTTLEEKQMEAAAMQQQQQQQNQFLSARMQQMGIQQQQQHFMSMAQASMDSAARCYDKFTSHSTCICGQLPGKYHHACCSGI